MITRPTINLNGTAPQDLLDQHLNAIAGLRCTISLLQAAAPNGHDDQLAPRDAFAKALGEHAARVGSLESVMSELELLAEFISDQC